MSKKCYFCNRVKLRSYYDYLLVVVVVDDDEGH